MFDAMKATPTKSCALEPIPTSFVKHCVNELLPWITPSSHVPNNARSAQIEGTEMEIGKCSFSVEGTFVCIHPHSSHESCCKNCLEIIRNERSTKRNRGNERKCPDEVDTFLCTHPHASRDSCCKDCSQVITNHKSSKKK